MAQFSTPDSDITVTNWDGLTFSTPNLNEEVQTEDGPSSYVFSSTSGAEATFGLGNATITDPVSNVNHHVNVEIWANNGATTFTIRLYESTDLIASWTQLHSGNWTSYQFDLTTVEADNISDYNDLRISVEHDQNAFKACSFLQFECPDAPTSNIDTVDGVSWTNLSSVKGVAKASIDSVDGVIV